MTPFEPNAKASTAAAPPGSPVAGAAPLPWRLEEIDLSAVDRASVENDETLFFLIATSAFVEMSSAVYTRNLSSHFAGDDELLEWLQRNWEQEEVQHGRALRAYVRAVWPEFDWDAAYRAFFEEYSARCTLAELEPDRALELAARCVVETGTATYYRTIHLYTSEPVLRAITGQIKSDEVRHYSYFLRAFERLHRVQPVARWAILRALVRRVREASDDDALIAYRHAFAVRYPQRRFEPADYDRFRADVKRIMRRCYPTEMAVKMLLKPLHLPAGLQRLLIPALSRGAGLVFV